MIDRDKGLLLYNDSILSDLLVEPSANGNYPWGPNYMFLLKNPYNIQEGININDHFMEALSLIRERQAVIVPA